MKQPFYKSAAVHIVVFLALIFGLPHLPSPPMDISTPIPIDITDIGPMTTTSKQGEGNQAAPKEVAPPPKPPQQEQKEPPKPPVKPEPAKAAAPEKAEEKPADDADISDKKKPEKKQEKKEDKAPEKIKDKPKEKVEKPKDKPAEDPTQQFNSLLKNLSAPKDETPPSPDATDAKEAKPNASTGSKGIVSERLTISQEDALRRQIEQCWNIPVGGVDVDKMSVEVKIEVNPDRTVKDVVVVDQARANSDPFFRSLSESAVRAVRNPRCSPLELPPDQYEAWKIINFRFTPKDMM